MECTCEREYSDVIFLVVDVLLLVVIVQELAKLEALEDGMLFWKAPVKLGGEGSLAVPSSLGSRPCVCCLSFFSGYDRKFSWG